MTHHLTKECPISKLVTENIDTSLQIKFILNGEAVEDIMTNFRKELKASTAIKDYIPHYLNTIGSSTKTILNEIVSKLKPFCDASDEIIIELLTPINTKRQYVLWYNNFVANIKINGKQAALGAFGDVDIVYKIDDLGNMITIKDLDNKGEFAIDMNDYISDDTQLCHLIQKRDDFHIECENWWELSIVNKDNTDTLEEIDLTGEADSSLIIDNIVASVKYLKEWQPEQTIEEFFKDKEYSDITIKTEKYNDDPQLVFTTTGTFGGTEHFYLDPNTPISAFPTYVSDYVFDKNEYIKMYAESSLNHTNGTPELENLITDAESIYENFQTFIEKVQDDINGIEHKDDIPFDTNIFQSEYIFQDLIDRNEYIHEDAADTISNNLGSATKSALHDLEERLANTLQQWLAENNIKTGYYNSNDN